MIRVSSGKKSRDRHMGEKTRKIKNKARKYILLDCRTGASKNNNETMEQYIQKWTYISPENLEFFFKSGLI